MTQRLVEVASLEEGADDRDVIDAQGTGLQVAQAFTRSFSPSTVLVPANRRRGGWRYTVCT